MGRGFELSARILEFPGGTPGDAGLFLEWQDVPVPARTPARGTSPTLSIREGSTKIMLLLTANGPLVIMTSYTSAQDAALLDKLKAKGIRKFIAFNVPLDLAKQRYANHFVVVAHDLHETDDLRVLDFDGPHAFQLFKFDELGEPLFHEGT